MQNDMTSVQKREKMNEGLQQRGWPRLDGEGGLPQKVLFELRFKEQGGAVSVGRGSPVEVRRGLRWGTGVTKYQELPFMAIGSRPAARLKLCLLISFHLHDNHDVGDVTPRY